MTCHQCNIQNGSGSNYCKSCGAALHLEGLLIKRKGDLDITLLLIYIGWRFVTLLAFTLMIKFVLPVLGNEGRANEFTGIYNITDWVTSGIDAVLLVVLSFLLKNKPARVCCAIFLLVKIGLAVFNFSKVVVQ